MPRSAFPFLLIVCLTGLLLARESRQPGGSLAGVDRAFFDWLSENSRPPPQAATGTVTLVEIDDTVADAPGRLPLGPLEYGSFLQAAGRYGPAVIAIAPVLDSTQASAGSEQILLDQALAVPRLLLATRLGSTVENPRDPASLTALTDVRGSVAAVPGFPEVVGAPNPPLLAVAAGSGAVNLPGDEKSPVRDLPLIFRCRDRVVPAFALETLRLSLRLAPSEVSVVLGSHVQLGDRLRVPIDRAGRALIDPRVFSRLNRLTLDDLTLATAGQAGPEVRAAAERMRGGVVILGRTDRAIRAFRLPNGRAVSQTEVFALAAASLPRTPALRRTGAGWDAGIIVGAALLGWRLRRARRSTALALCAGTLAVYALGALVLFEARGLWLPGALPAGLTLGVGLLLWMLPTETA